MTDFYTAARNRENEIIQDTRKQLENYQIKVIHWDGLYRNLECYDPEKGAEGCFAVYFAPWIVTIIGDWFSAYTLRWMPDIFARFRGKDEPKIGYWSIDVLNRTSLETTEPEFMLRWLFDYLEEWSEESEEDGMDEETLNRCKHELEQYVNLDDPYIIWRLNEWTFSYKSLDGQYLEVAPFDTLNEAEWDIWTEEWIRVCELLRWTACKVTAMEATQ